jgi:hypothetical protein
VTHNQLFELFKSTNKSVNIKEWYPLVGDECEMYADTTKPMIKVILDDESWLRVYVDQKYHEVTWY